VCVEDKGTFSIHKGESPLHETCGVDLSVTEDRVILLDCQVCVVACIYPDRRTVKVPVCPKKMALTVCSLLLLQALLSASVLDKMIRTESPLPAGISTYEQLLELVSLQVNTCQTQPGCLHIVLTPFVRV
jgi:hypothetical protein